MAYAAVVTVDRVQVSRRPVWVVTVVETEAANGSEFVVPASALPAAGEVLSHKSTLVSGSGATIDPEVGTAAAWTANTQAAMYANGGAAAHVHFVPTAPTGLFRQSTGLHVRSKVNAGADNVIHTQIIIAPPA